MSEKVLNTNTDTHTEKTGKTVKTGRDYDYVVITYLGRTYSTTREKALEYFENVLREETGDARKQAVEIHYQLRGGESRCYAEVNRTYNRRSETWKYDRKGRKRNAKKRKR